MSDKEEAHTKFSLQVVKQVNDLRLNRHVESAHGLISHNELWLQSDRTGNADALALSSGELMGKAVVMLWIKTHALHQGLYCALYATFGGDVLNLKRCRDNTPNCVAWVKRSEWILEDDLHFRAV